MAAGADGTIVDIMASSRYDGVRELFATPRFRQLLTTRLISQTADGVYQASLAGAVLFNPEHHTSPSKVATGFVVLLLPYSLLGPFAGVLLDRWRRQRVLVYGAATKTVLVLATATLLVVNGPSGAPFALTALLALAVNRFYLAALSAALPNVVPANRLVLANAISPTAGTVVTIAGGGIGLGVRGIAGSGDHGNAVVAAVAAVVYLAAAFASATMPRDALGPMTRAGGAMRVAVVAVARDLVAGARHAWDRRAVTWALGVIFGQRFLFGIWTMMALLLYRNSFHSHGVLRAGLVGVGQAVTLGGVGLVIGAALTPRVTSRVGKSVWIIGLTASLTISVCAAAATYSMWLLLVAAPAVGIATQGTKVCVDTIVQTEIEDDFRGRLFSIYDTAYNISFVAGAVAAATVLPTSGKSGATLAVMAVAYLLIAIWYAAVSDQRPVTIGSLMGKPADQPAQQAADQT
jgi:MFS family permease